MKMEWVAGEGFKDSAEVIQTLSKKMIEGEALKAYNESRPGVLLRSINDKKPRFYPMTTLEVSSRGKMYKSEGKVLIDFGQGAVATYELT